MSPIQAMAVAIAEYTDQRMPRSGDVITCEGIARAALDALADNVSEGMCREGYLEWECATDEGYFYPDEDDMKLVFRSMLKAAREEG